MQFKALFLFIVATSTILVFGLLVHVNVCGIGTFSYVLPVVFDEYATHRNTVLTTRKPFVYLTETEQCLPPYLASSSQIGDPQTCHCDVIVLSYRTKCYEQNNQSHVSYLFDPNTLFASGRNVLFFAAMDRRPGYHYYIFLNDDTTLEYNNLAPADMKKLSPFRTVESWLLDYEPVVGVLHYKHHGAGYIRKFRKQSCGINETASLVLPTVFYDALFNAYHHKAIQHILSYPTQYERGCVFCSNRQAMIAVEVKFGGQALLFAPVTGGNPLHRRDDNRRLKMAYREREFVDYIRQEAPAKLKSHVIFEQLNHTNATEYLSKRSRSYCANVTRHQPIIPYKHLLSDS